MSATSAPADASVAPVKTGKKKLIVLVSVLALLLASAGGGAFYFMKKRAAAQAEDSADADGKAAKTVRADAKHAPTFVPLDPFTVNLADREAERYAQVGMTLELGNPKAGDLLKAYMPAIRNNILLVLSSKTAAQLIEHEGKMQLAAEVRAAALKPLGFVIKPGVEPASEPGHDQDDDDTPPIRAVHFSNFIIQ